MFELIEVDPVTCEEDHLLATGTLRQMEKELDDVIADMLSDWEEGGSWSWLRIQPAS